MSALQKPLSIETSETCGNFTLVVDPSITIAQLKTKIATATSIPVADQLLLYHSNPLKDESTVEELNITDSLFLVYCRTDVPRNVSRITVLYAELACTIIYNTAIEAFRLNQVPFTGHFLKYKTQVYLNLYWKGLTLQKNPFIIQKFKEFNSCSRHAPVCIFHSIEAAVYAIIDNGLFLDASVCATFESFCSSLKEQLDTLKIICTVALESGLHKTCDGEFDIQKLDAYDPLHKFESLEALRHKCTVCEVEDSKQTLFRCAGCGQKQYCCKEHQKEHWYHGHKDRCIPNAIRSNAVFQLRFHHTKYLPECTAKMDVKQDSVILECSAQSVLVEPLNAAQNRMQAIAAFCHRFRHNDFEKYMLLYYNAGTQLSEDSKMDKEIVKFHSESLTDISVFLPRFRVFEQLVFKYENNLVLPLWAILFYHPIKNPSLKKNVIVKCESNIVRVVAARDIQVGEVLIL